MVEANQTGGWRVVLFTATAFAVPVLKERLRTRGHKLVGVVAALGPRSRRTNDYQDVAQHASPGLDVIVSNYPNRWADMIRPLRPDLLWCLSFNWKIPQPGSPTGNPTPCSQGRCSNAATTVRC